MPKSSRCNECDTPIPEDAPLGLCPRCLIREAREEEGPESASALEGEGDQIGPYKLLQKIGEGGFGVVFMAEQSQPVKRQVALKIIKAGMDTRQVIARFEAERQALAMMEHPNIARVLDAGATETGRPYFAMELVRGVPITVFCDEHSLGNKQRLELFQDACAAVGHAHQKGIIHRDLKPSNILIGMHGDTPVVKVIDFGVAKATELQLTDKTLFTHFGQFIGTPLYISPEQASLSPIDIDTRSDIYSLGILLYELLTGKPPLDQETLKKAGFDEMRRLIREQEAPKPSTRLSTETEEELRTIAKARRTEPRKLGSFIRGDLDWIVLKALEKERERRYDTANALRLDIRRFLANEPVSAAAPNPLYRFRKFAHRRRGPLAAVAAILLAILAGSAVSIHQGIRATREAKRTREALGLVEAASDTMEESLYRFTILQAHNDLEEDRISAIRDMLDHHVPGPGKRDRRSWEWFYLKSRLLQAEFTLEAGQGELWAVAWAPDGKIFAAAGQSGLVVVRDGKTHEVLHVLEGHRGAVRALAWNTSHPNLLASAGDDQTVIIWEVDARKPKWKFSGHHHRVNALAWHPGGDILASGAENGTVMLTDAAKGGKVGLVDIGNAVRSLAWHPDPSALPEAASLPSGTAGVLCAGSQSEGDPAKALTLLAYRETTPDTGSDSLRILARPPAPRGWVSSVDWSADGKDLAGYSMTALFVREGGFGERRGHRWTAHQRGQGVVAWHPHQRILATSGEDRMIKIWDPDRSGSIARLRGHDGPVTQIAWHPGGRRLLSCSKDGTIMEWDPGQGVEGPVLHRAARWISSVSWNPDGSELAVASWQRDVHVIDARTGRVKRVLRGHTGKVPGVAWSPDGRRIATAGYDSRVRIWNAGTGELLTMLEHDESQEHVAWSQDGSQLAVLSWWWNHQFDKDNLKLTVWTPTDVGDSPHLVLLDPDRNDGSYLRTRSFAWHPHLPMLATGTGEGGIFLWDGHSGRLLQRLNRVVPGGAHTIAWNCSGDRMVVGGASGQLTSLAFRDGALREPEFTKAIFTGAFTTAAWSPDGTRLAGSSSDGAIKIIDPLTGDRLLDLLVPHEDGEPIEVPALAWSPDGRRLVTGGYDNCVRVWDATRGYAWEAARLGREANSSPSGGDDPILSRQPAALKTHHYTFNDGTFRDLAGNLDGRTVGAATISGGVLHLRGGTGELDGAALALSAYHSLSIELWSASDRTANTGYHVLFGAGEVDPDKPGLASNYLVLSPARGNDTMLGAIATRNRGANPWIYETGVERPEINDGREHHYVLTLSEASERIELFVDGVSAGRAATRQKLSDVASGIASLGRLYSQDAPWQGSVNEFAIYEGALTAEEVAKAYAAGPVAGGADDGK